MIPPADRVALVRAISLIVPISSALLLLQRMETSARERGAILLATLWNVIALLALQPLARQLSWWSFGVEGGTLAGSPLDLILGWSVLWGCVAPLLLHSRTVILRSLLVLLLDLAVMPLCGPAVLLGNSWLLGELIMIALAFVPSQLLERWTREESHLSTRALMQAAIFSALMLWVFPASLLELRNGSFEVSSATGLALQLLPLAALIGLTAVQEFVTRGGGTPFPYDPPKKLVTSGVYAYVRNPMQLSMTLTLLIWGVALNSWWVACAAIGSLAFATGFARWSEQAELQQRFGIEWTSYASSVRSWIPRWRPSMTEHSRLYVADTCGQCQQLRRWLSRQRATRLEVLAAEDYPNRRLERITYVAADGHEQEGVAALARALEHIHLGWAIVSFTMRLPLIRQLLQIITDAVGGGPRTIPMRSESAH
jgi:protein-S-isoprenylcysteine O-methyltransferase Ste14